MGIHLLGLGNFAAKLYTSPKEVTAGMAIFTPDDEPYLGRQSVYHFDQVLIQFIAEQQRISESTRTASLSPIQRAASEIVPSASSVALSIRELVRQGYLLSALILTRPLFERVATMSYLIENPGAVTLWEQGWPHKTRPTLKQRVSAMQSAGSGDDPRVPIILERYNGLVHGDPAGALHGAVLLPSGGAGFTTGKDLGSPARADEVCFETTMWLIVLSASCKRLFPLGDS